MMPRSFTDRPDPHAEQPVLRTGPEPERATGAILLVHGRGASAQDILPLYDELGQPGLHALAPQAAGSTWYPHSFLAPIASNQPFLDSALRRLDFLVEDLIGRGLASERIALLGFSQGACLMLEFIFRRPRRYGAAAAFSGALLSPPGTIASEGRPLAGTPVLLGACDPDPHVPYERVRQTRAMLERLGATAELRRYPGASHGINDDEVDAARSLLVDMVAHPPPGRR